MLSGPVLLPKSGKVKQAVILLHGYGDSGSGMMDIAQHWQNSLPDTAFLAPNAPEICAGWPAGFQWFAIRATEALNAKDFDRAEMIKPSTEKLNQYIDKILKDYKLDENRLAVFGFSQGAMMAMYAMPRRPNSCAGILAYSGMLVAGPHLKNEAKSKMPVLIVHGALDVVVPPFCLKDAQQGFENAGFEVEAVLRPYLPHSIDSFGLERGAEFIAESLIKSAA
jgi:phospholipase/carboxylesterase